MKSPLSPLKMMVINNIAIVNFITIPLTGGEEYAANRIMGAKKMPAMILKTMTVKSSRLTSFSMGKTNFNMPSKRCLTV